MTLRRPPQLAAELYRGGARIFLTMCTLKRTTCFDSDHVVNPVRDQLHALFSGLSEDADALRCIRTFRQKSGFEDTSIAIFETTTRHSLS
jgi:hypothetical protein